MKLVSRSELPIEEFIIDFAILQELLITDLYYLFFIIFPLLFLDLLVFTKLNCHELLPSTAFKKLESIRVIFILIAFLQTAHFDFLNPTSLAVNFTMLFCQPFRKLPFQPTQKALFRFIIFL